MGEFREHTLLRVRGHTYIPVLSCVLLDHPKIAHLHRKMVTEVDGESSAVPSLTSMVRSLLDTLRSYFGFQLALLTR